MIKVIVLVLTSVLLPCFKLNAQNNEFMPKDIGNLHCDNYYLVDISNNQVLLDERSNELIYPGSLVKMMTAIVGLENMSDLDEVYSFEPEVLEGLKEAQANRAGFWTGDRASYRDLIYGAMLPSGAECTRAIADIVAGSEDDFVLLMNAKAKQLGMSNTNFVNSSGLHDDNQYSTCKDMAKLFIYCLKNPEFKQIIQTEKHVSIPTKNYPQGLTMTNAVLMYVNQEEPIYNNYDIPGFVGGKSGFTLEGEYTLASLAEFNGMELVLVNCHGYVEPHYPASIEDAYIIFNWYNENFERRILNNKGDLLKRVNVRNTLDGDINIYHKSTIDMDLPNNDNCHIVVDIPDEIDAEVSRGAYLGKLQIYAYDELLVEERYYSLDTKTYSIMGACLTFIQEYYIPILAILAIILGINIYYKRKDNIEV